jgi:GNAT superfamily N-acetyltransferase
MSPNACRIVPVIGELPRGFELLLAEARADGHAFVERFHMRWHQGEERYERENEGMFAAWLDGRLAGFAAMGPDPYVPDAAIGRLRHVFVIRAARRKGVARALVETCLERGRSFDLIRLRTRNPEAARLYERLGFAPVALEDATHIRPRMAASLSSPRH